MPCICVFSYMIGTHELIVSSNGAFLLKIVSPGGCVSISFYLHNYSNSHLNSIAPLEKNTHNDFSHKTGSVVKFDTVVCLLYLRNGENINFNKYCEKQNNVLCENIFCKS